MPLVRAHKLKSFLLGTIQPPTQFLEILDLNGRQNVIRTLNPYYIIWNQQDQYLMSQLLSSMAESMLKHVTRCVRAAGIWYTLERLNLIQSQAKVLQLRAMLQTFKKGEMSIEEYFVKKKMQLIFLMFLVVKHSQMLSYCCAFLEVWAVNMSLWWFT